MFKTIKLNKIIVWLTSIMLICFSVSVSIVTAQCSGSICEIDYNTEADGFLIAGSEDVWTFFGEAGDVVTIAMDGDFDTFLDLYSPAGFSVALDDDSGGNLNALIEDFRLPITGVYTIYAGSFSSAFGGDYTLSLTTSDSVSGASSALNGDGSEIELNETVEGFLASFSTDSWTFFGQSGTVVTIQLDGEFDTQVELIDPNGRSIAFDDDGGAGLNSLIEDFRLPSTGTYTIVVLAFFGSSSGDYTLTLESSSTATTTGSSSNGGSSNGSVEAVSELQTETDLVAQISINYDESVADTLTQTVVANGFDLSMQIPEDWFASSFSLYDFFVTNGLEGDDEVSLIIQFNNDMLFGINSEEDATDAIFTVGNFIPVSIGESVFYHADINLPNLTGFAASRYIREGYYVTILAGSPSRSTWAENEDLVYAIAETIGLATVDEFEEFAQDTIDLEVTFSNEQSINGFSVNLPEDAIITNGDIFTFGQFVTGTAIAYNVETSLELEGFTALRVWRFRNNMSRVMNSFQLAIGFTLLANDLDYEFIMLGDTSAVVMSINGLANVYGVIVNVDGHNFAVVVESQDNIPPNVQDIVNQIALSISIP